MFGLGRSAGGGDGVKALEKGAQGLCEKGLP